MASNIARAGDGKKLAALDQLVRLRQRSTVSTMRNRPRVFLSHSKSNEAFISRLYGDLQQCQIHPWYDSVDIRHGEPWLDAIFEGGIPTCDCVLVYLTEESIESAMVKKEIDASLIQKLKDSRIGFLPYVSKVSLRERLRPDIQSLQIPEWNEGNYHTLLPRVVAEIWHIYFEKTMLSAISTEKAKRLEFELELNRLKERQLQDGIFSESEELDFQYIHKRLSHRKPVIYVRDIKPETKPESKTELYYSVGILSLVQAIFEAGFYSYNDYDVRWLLEEAIENMISKGDVQGLHCEEYPELSNDLLMFGFIQNFTFTKNVRDYQLFGRSTAYRTELETRFEFTPKVHRFRYWLAVNNFSQDTIDILPNKTNSADAKSAAAD